MTIGRFLGGIAAIIWDAQSGRYLLLRRSAEKDFLSGDWECVTGRVEQGESYTQAAQREIQEEIGTAARIEFLIGVTHFYRGAQAPQNELLGVLYGCSLDAPEQVRLEAEHSELRWATTPEAETFLPEGHWLRPVLHRADHLRRRLPDDLRQEFRQGGLEF